MFFSKSYHIKKLDLLWIVLILLGTCSIFIKNDPEKNNTNTTVFYSTEMEHSIANASWSNADIFAPGIAAVLTSSTRTFNGDTPGCTYIRFIVRVMNTSTNDEQLDNITIDMGPDVQIGSLQSGSDANNNGILDTGEIWAYEAIKTITETDMQASEVFHQAHVEANVVGIGGTVTDDSHPTDINLDGSTLTKISNCVKGISLVKTGISKNPLGEDGGCASINYTFEVSHTGSPTEMFGTVVITDPMLESENIPINGPIDGDFGTPDLLEPGETWIYEANYPIQGDDLINGFVENQAYVEAKTFVVPGLIASDISDHTSTDEDRITRIDIPQCQPLISLIQTGVAKDGFGQDGGCDFIEYTFTVTNESDPNNGQGQVLKDILLDDSYLPLPEILVGPNGDINDDGLMSPGEVWTYSAIYQVTSQDILNGEVVTQSQVYASIVEGPQITITDLSDFEDTALNRETVVSLSHCPRIAVIKEGTVNAECTAIDYVFTVTNESKESLILENVELTDPKLPVIDGPTGDNGNDLLELGEIWTYTATYNITPEDINAGHVDNQATASADVFTFPNLFADDLSDDDSVMENQITSTDLTSCQTPTIELIKEGQLIDDDENGCLDTILYTFTVTNTGNVDLHTVILNDDKIGGQVPGPELNEDDGNDGILSIGEDWVFKATYNLLQADIDAGFVINNADVSALSVGIDTPTADQVLVQTDLPADLCAPAPAIEVIKSSVLNIDNDNDGCLDGITYTFTITNVGNVNLHTVVLNDDKIGGVVPGPEPNEDDNNDGVLSIGEDWVYEATYAMTPQEIIDGFVFNNADVSALSEGDNTPVADQAQVQTDLPVDLCGTAPAIQLFKVGNPSIDLDANGCIDGILYTFTVTNVGNVNLHTIVLNDDKIGGVVLGPEPNEDDNNDGILSVGEDWVFKATYDLIQADIDAGLVINNAEVAALSEGDNTPVADQAQVQTNLPADLCTFEPNIGLIKIGEPIDTDQDNCIDSITYIFMVTNTGQLDLQEVLLEDDLFGGEIPGPEPDSDFGNDGILSVGESWIYEATYPLSQQNINDDFVDNQATVQAEPVNIAVPINDLSDDNSLFEDDVTHTSLPANICVLGTGNLALLKSGVLTDIDQDGCFESIQFSFRVLNTGEIDMESIILNDPLLGGVINGPTAGSDIENDGILSVGETWTYDLLYGITDQDINMGSFTNQATVTGLSVGTNQEAMDFSDDDSPLEDDPTNTPVPNDACTSGGATLGVIKSGVLTDTNGDECPDGIRYTFTVTNTGTADLHELQIVDDDLLDAEIVGPLEGTDLGEDNILSVNETWEYTAIYTIEEIDVTNGFKSNQATVYAKPVGIDVQVFDVSDDDSLLENETTVTAIPEFYCANNPGGDSEFEIFTGITPNSDGFNDYFRIQGIENYPDNTLKIFNRWGTLVYEAEGYGLGNKLFFGVSEGRATIQKKKTLPSGTYFYILTFPNENPGEESYSGYLYINRD
ncbi:gliding motility-associated C-terminal domain-containing protein [Flagellimonas lutimaris]|uniref:gliding motility-associated C-terminal domain-containing protein n=1 Tax=Flagellimonas lutimaris TaxID=475082 RepID=UPI003F5CD2D6